MRISFIWFVYNFRFYLNFWFFFSFFFFRYKTFFFFSIVTLQLLLSLYSEQHSSIQNNKKTFLAYRTYFELVRILNEQQTWFVGLLRKITTIVFGMDRYRLTMTIFALKCISCLDSGAYDSGAFNSEDVILCVRTTKIQWNSTKCNHTKSRQTSLARCIMTGPRASTNFTVPLTTNMLCDFLFLRRRARRPAFVLWSL